MANIQIAENRPLSELLEIALSTQANLNRILLEKIEAKDKTIELLQIENQQKCNEKLELQEKLDDSEDEKLELQEKLDDSEDEKLERKDSGLKTCGSNACLARVLGQNKGFCLSWLIVNKRGEVTVFRGLLRIEIDLVSSSISKVFAQEGVQ